MPSGIHRIPGTTPIDDISGLIPPGIRNYSDLSAAEAENIIGAWNKHLRRRHNPSRPWFTETFLRKVHTDMFAKVWSWAGHYRKSEYNIGVAVHKIREEIYKLCEDLKYWNSLKKNKMPILERAVRIHHRLAWVHPFPNGNGRHARMIADIYLFSNRHPLPLWPISKLSAQGRSRKDYLNALRSADKGDFHALMEYTIRFLPSQRAS